MNGSIFLYNVVIIAVIELWSCSALILSTPKTNLPLPSIYHQMMGAGRVTCTTHSSIFRTNMFPPTGSGAEPEQTSSRSESKDSSKPGPGAVMIPPDGKLGIGTMAVGTIITVILKLTALGFPLSVLGGFLTYRASKDRFVFDNEAMEVMAAENEKAATVEELKLSGDNFAVGGRNRWKYSTFTEWGFIPSNDVPLFVYFKETQTNGPGNEPQFHLFPVIMKADKLLEQLTTRVGVKP